MNKRKDQSYSEASQIKESSGKKPKKASKLEQTTQKTREISNEEETMQQTIQPVEETRLIRSFLILCGIPKNSNPSEIALGRDKDKENEQNLELMSFSKNELVKELYVLLEQSEPDQKMSKQRRIEMKHEIEQIADNMIWEVDEDLDQQISWYEFKLMYKRCIFDKSGLEPRSLFNLVEFLMFDKYEKKRITIEDTLELLYVKCNNYKQDSNLDLEIEEIFGKEETFKATEGQEKEITWKEYLEKVTQRAINQRKQKEEEKKSINTKKKNTESQMS